MTDIRDLYDTPQERLEATFKDFIRRLELEHEKKEEDLDRMFEQARTKLHRLNLKTQYAYKMIFDEILVKLNHQDDVEILRFFESVIRSSRKDLYADVFERADPVIRQAEREGRGITISIDNEGAASRSCIYADRKKGYFSFIDVFMDGFDDSYEFKVVRTDKEPKAVKEEKERMRIREILRKHDERKVTVEKAAEAVESAGLVEVDFATVLGGLLGEALENTVDKEKKEEAKEEALPMPPRKTSDAGITYFS